MRLIRWRWIALVGAALLLAGCQKKPASADEPLGVEQLAKNPAAYAGRGLRVHGVVSSVMPKKGVFTLIDVEEYKSCRELGCSAFEVPVAFAGALPDTAKAVLVAGRLEQPEPGRYLVRAERVEPGQ